MKKSPTGSVRRFFSAAIIALLLAACAQQVAPTGGAVDREPPKILKSTPTNEAVNFAGHKILLEFDEFVQLKNANAQLIVSPPLKTDPEFTLRGKRVEVEWTDTLDSNTTYMFQFGNGIVDLHESNPLDSNIFVFSTGDFIDSMQLKGSVRNAFDLKPAPDVWVMLYTKDVDSLPLTSLPRYFAKTDKNGVYNVRYMQPGAYKVFALKSEGQGYIYDNPEEKIGFATELFESVQPTQINPSDSGATSGPSMLLFQEFDSVQYVKEYLLTDNKVLVLRMQMNVDSMTVTDLTGKNIDGWLSEWNTARDSVAYWFDSVLVEDSLYLRVQTSDGFDDTITVRKRSLGRAKKKGNNNGLELQVPARKNRQPYYSGMLLKATEPLASINPEKWVLTLDSDTIDLNGLVTMDFKDVTMNVKWKQGKSYRLLIPDSTMTSRFGKANDTIQFKFNTTSKDDYGQMKFKIDFEGVDHNLIWQLLRGEKVVDERIVQGKSVINYDYLAGGTYQVKVLYDANNNGKWDTGDYNYKRQPERVLYYDGVIEVRSSWAEEIEWQVSDTR